MGIRGAKRLGAVALVAIAGACQAGPLPSPTTVASPSRAPAATPAAEWSPPRPEWLLPKGLDEPEPEPKASLVPARSCDTGLVPGSMAGPNGLSIPRSFRLRTPILEYHRISPRAEAGGSMPGLVVTPEQFAAQLEALQAAGWQAITLGQMADYLDSGVQPPGRKFVITIDDGLEDGYTYALPVLQHLGMVATYFVVTGRLDHPGNLTAAELVRLANDGMEIGNHTLDHVRLSARSKATVAYEIDSASATIAGVTGRWPAAFSYPRGSTDGTVDAALRACRPIRIAVMGGGAVAGATVSRYLLPRIEVGPGKTPSLLVSHLARFARVQ